MIDKELALINGEYWKLSAKEAFRFLYSEKELMRFKASEVLGKICKGEKAYNYIQRLFWHLSDESGAYCVGAPLGIAEIGRENPKIFESFKLKYLYLIENEEVEKSYVAYGIYRNAEIYKSTEATAVLEEKIKKYSELKFKAYSALALFKLGFLEIFKILKNESGIFDFYDGKRIVKIDFRDFLKRLSTYNAFDISANFMEF